MINRFNFPQGISSSFIYTINFFSKDRNPDPAAISKFLISGVPWQIRVFEGDKTGIFVGITNLSDRDYFGCFDIFAEELMCDQKFVKSVKYRFVMGKETKERISEREVLEKRNLLFDDRITLIFNVSNSFLEFFY